MKETKIKELTKKVNEFRTEHIGSQYSSKEIYDELYKMGFNKHISIRVAALFPTQKLGTSKYYEMTGEPIHQSKIASLYEDSKRYTAKSRNKGEELTEKSALELLNTLGYRIKKIVRFDMEKFIKEQPEMYRRYCKYEYV